MCCEFLNICKQLANEEYALKTKASIVLQNFWKRAYYTKMFKGAISGQMQRFSNAALKIQRFFRAKSLLFLLKIYILRMRHAITHVQRWYRACIHGNAERSAIELQRAAKAKHAMIEIEKRQRFVRFMAKRKANEEKEMDDMKWRAWKSNVDKHNGFCRSSMPHLDEFDTDTLGGCLHGAHSSDHTVVRKGRAEFTVAVQPITIHELNQMAIIKAKKLAAMNVINSMNLDTIESKTKSLDAVPSVVVKKIPIAKAIVEMAVELWKTKVIREIWSWIKKKKMIYGIQINSVNDVL